MSAQLGLFHSNRCRKQSAEHIAKRTAYNIGKPKSEETRRKVSLAKMGSIPWNKIHWTPEMDEELTQLYTAGEISLPTIERKMGIRRGPILQRAHFLGLPIRVNGSQWKGKKMPREMVERRIASVKRIGKRRGVKLSQERRERMSRIAIEALSRDDFFKQGRHYSPKLNKTMWHRSGYEKTYMEQLDEDDNVAWYEYEPKSVTITYEFDGMKRRYKPDFLITFVNGDKKLVEIKSTYTVTFARTQAKLAAVRSLRDAGSDLPPMEVLIGTGRTMEVAESFTI